MIQLTLPRYQPYTHPNQLLKLKDKWDGNRAVAITSEAVNTATAWMWILFLLNKPFIGPMTNGGVLLEWIGFGWEFNIDITGDGKVDSFYLGREN